MIETGLVAFPTSGQEMDRPYSLMPATRTDRSHWTGTMGIYNTADIYGETQAINYVMK